MVDIVIEVFKRNGKSVGEFRFGNDATVDSIKYQVHRTIPYMYPSRQWLTIGNDDKTKIPLKDNDKKLSELVQEGLLKTQDKLYLKDLGPQIGWKTVFHIEYAGPILFHALFYYARPLFYSNLKPFTFTQTAAFWLVVIHFLKREYETHFIHRFSLETMPVINIFKNSFHYWILSGLNIAYFLYSPEFTETKSKLVIYVAIALFLFAEFKNYKCHCILRDLRPAGTKVRGNPRGDLFEYVACANYTYELMAWLVFAFFTQTLTAYFFFLVSFSQIAVWAKKKGKALPKEPKGRKYLIPFVW